MKKIIFTSSLIINFLVSIAPASTKLEGALNPNGNSKMIDVSGFAAEELYAHLSVPVEESHSSSEFYTKKAQGISCSRIEHTIVSLNPAQPLKQELWFACTIKVTEFGIK